MRPGPGWQYQAVPQATKDGTRVGAGRVIAQDKHKIYRVSCRAGAGQCSNSADRPKYSAVEWLCWQSVAAVDDRHGIG
jgi:hypothetical protein